jgi:predicted ArsR family transcriptional regulator
VLANCPFHALAREHTALVCGMNLHLITAMLNELGHAEVQARLDPASDRCCVMLFAKPT